MSARDDGGAAFPSQPFINGNDDVIVSAAQGMSLRDYFAAHAPQPAEVSLLFVAEAIVGYPMPQWPEDLAGYCKFWDTYRARRAYQFADAMLAERAK